MANPIAEAFKLLGMQSFEVYINELGKKAPTISGWPWLPPDTPPASATNWGYALTNDFLVLDVDTKNNKKGLESFEKLKSWLTEPLPELMDIVASAYKYAKGQIGVLNQANRLKDFTAEELRFMKENDSTTIEHKNVPNDAKITYFTAKSLLKEEFEPLHFVVPDLLPEGLALLVGRPKSGKSWMALGICIAVATGGMAINQKPTEKAGVLYLALEDSARRLQTRMRKISDGGDLNNLCFATDFPRASEGGLTELKRYLDEHPDCRLVVIDTLQLFRKISTKESYGTDYDALSTIQKFALRKRITMLLIHHTRKSDSNDPFEKVSGTTAILGAADTAWILERLPNEAQGRLYIKSREIGDQDVIVEFDEVMFQWTILGNSGELENSQEEDDVLFLIQSHGPVKARDLERSLGLTDVAARQRLSRMHQNGKLQKIAFGTYAIPDKDRDENRIA